MPLDFGIDIWRIISKTCNNYIWKWLKITGVEMKKTDPPKRQLTQIETMSVREPTENPQIKIVGSFR